MSIRSRCLPRLPDTRSTRMTVAARSAAHRPRDWTHGRRAAAVALGPSWPPRVAQATARPPGRLLAARPARPRPPRGPWPGRETRRPPAIPAATAGARSPEPAPLAHLRISMEDTKPAQPAVSSQRSLGRKEPR